MNCDQKKSDGAGPARPLWTRSQIAKQNRQNAPALLSATKAHHRPASVRGLKPLEKGRPPHYLKQRRPPGRRFQSEQPPQRAEQQSEPRRLRIAWARPESVDGLICCASARQFTRDATDIPRRRFCFSRKGLASWDAGRGVSPLPRGHHRTVGRPERSSPDWGQSLLVSPRDPCGVMRGSAPL